MKVYIAGPYTKGDVGENVHTAIKVAEQVVNMGHTPFVPHLSHFWHLIRPRPYEFWLDYDLVWLRVCDVVLRYPGESLGADREVRVAEEAGIPVCHGIDEFYRFSISQREVPNVW